ncbi:MAG: hypothetical protein KF845_02975 [Cyclobacteriaceae bacterium]|nr:hypothetical protein [Cyclobacteriaceae bacterium]
MKGTLEKTIFRFILVLAVTYQFYQVINGLLSSASTILLNTGIALFIAFIYFLTFRVKNIRYLAFSFHLAVLLIMIYFWKESGGLAGTVPLVVFIYSTWIILTLRGWLQVLMLSICLLVFVCLTEFSWAVGIRVADPGKIPPLQLAIDYFVITIILAAFLIFLKNKFLSHRKHIEHRHQQLQNLAGILLKQTDTLRHSQEEIRSINENLELIIEQRIRRIEERNLQLEEYAFINAHIVRGPLCRIMGLTTLIQQEQNDSALSAVQEKAKHVDAIIRRINEITR